MSGFWSHPSKLVLASASKVRSTILGAAGIPHVVFPALIDEREVELRSGLHQGEKIAQLLAREKALDVSFRMPGCLVLGADQTLTLEGAQLHKPGTLEAARAQLRLLSGKTNQLNSAMAVALDGKLLFETVAIAQLRMRHLTEEFISAYCEVCGEDILASVGCYQIEKAGIQLFESIRGDQFTIMGLPILSLLAFFRRQGMIVS